jgi:hypothetical protein
LGILFAVSAAPCVAEGIAARRLDRRYQRAAHAHRPAPVLKATDLEYDQSVNHRFCSGAAQGALIPNGATRQLPIGQVHPAFVGYTNAMARCASSRPTLSVRKASGDQYWLV